MTDPIIRAYVIGLFVMPVLYGIGWAICCKDEHRCIWNATGDLWFLLVGLTIIWPLAMAVFLGGLTFFLVVRFGVWVADCILERVRRNNDRD